MYIPVFNVWPLITESGPRGSSLTSLVKLTLGTQLHIQSTQPSLLARFDSETKYLNLKIQHKINFIRL